MASGFADDLEIPDFLRRVEGQPVKYGSPTKPRIVRYKPKEHAGERTRLLLNDELPRIGSGVRTVYVLKKARKWVTVEYQDHKHHIRRHVWDRLKVVE